ncbi:MAG: cation diffusion facilitator family transporter [Lachnospiraceae bacterium]|nr:cation diffusion facilitator family transporter [Lachnospiraceae bacterium]
MAKEIPTTLDENEVIRQISLVTMIGNIVLCAFKLFAGIVGKSGAMLSDAIHSLSDVVITFVAFWGAKMSRRGADKEHPYGHERLECIASLILGVILLVTGLGIGKVGLQIIFSGNYEKLMIPGVIALAAAVISIVVKEAMYWYTMHYAKILNSAAFMADAWHHRSDVFASIGSLIGIGGAMLGFPVLDAVAGVVICLFILRVAFDILLDAVKKMLDTSCGEEYEKKLSEYVLTQNGVVGIDMLRTRMFGNKVYVDLEISVDADKTFREAHTIAEKVHYNVEKDFPDTKHIMIHVNPTEQIS